ncbi:hypothetical protein [Acinetobacter seifertii]|uniref:hypothetical protein n=1 Tax=Acinetobacter seifertii TaxID=1530123 RepID=UPI001E55D3BC|nr:hypothetical protein [Acinetobacter seifertii]
MSNKVTTPYPLFSDIDGSPLIAGFLFFGESGKDAKQFPISVYWDEAKTLLATQPISVRNGLIVKDNVPSAIFIEELSCSVAINDRNYYPIRQLLSYDQLSSVKVVKSLVDAEKSRALAAEANLQLQITTSNSGIKYFETEAQLLAFTPSGTDPQQAYAFDTKKNYLWNAATAQWKDEGLSSLAIANNYTDEQIKKLGFKRGVNIFDKTNVEQSKFYNYLNGKKEDASSSYVAAGLYEIDGNTEYQVPANYNQQFAFFNSQKVFISGQLSAGSTHKFTTPVNAKYIGLTVEVVQLDAFMLCKSSEYPKVYTPYYVKKPDLKVETGQVENLYKDVRNNIGFHQINIFDSTLINPNHYIDYTNGNQGVVAGYAAAGPYEVKAGVEYRVSDNYNQQFAFYDEALAYVSGMPSPNTQHKFTVPLGAKYIKLTVPNSQLSTLVIAESALFPDNYVPYGSVKIDGLVVDDGSIKTTGIKTSADTSDTTAAFTGKNAVQLALNSITDATDKKRYVINAKGYYKVDKALDVIGYPGYPSMILAKDHVDIVGDGKTLFWCELPYNDADIGPSADGNTYPRTQYQTLYSYAKDCLIKDVTFVVVNARYALHLDNPLGANVTHKFDGVWFIFKGDKGSKQALGIGTSTGEKLYFKGGGSHSDSGTPLYCHNNTKFSDPSGIYFNGHKLSSNTSKLIGRIESDGSLLNDQMEYIGCSFGGTAYVIEYGELWLRANPAQNYDSFNHAEWQLTGYGNEPFLFDNKVNGYCLRFKTTAIGSGNTIRFDKTSSAYPLLIKNNQANTDVSLYVDSRDYIDGYIVQDGTTGLSAMAFGCKDLTETAAFADSGVVYTSMGKRLGNCSTSNKTLGVIINGTTYTVTFNKDYTSMSNAAILAEINTALTGATVDLYVYGRDYYPMMTDVAETVYNSGSAYIPKGSVVAKSGGTVKLANANDKLYGVALDDIPVMTTTAEGMKKGQGRVLKRGYIYADRTKAHFVLADNQNPPLGTRFSVSSGQLVTDTNGKISVDIDTGVISINC